MRKINTIPEQIFAYFGVSSPTRDFYRTSFFFNISVSFP